MASNFDEFLHYKVLAVKFNRLQGDQFSGLIDSVIDAAGEGNKALPLKNVCAKLSVPVADELEEVTALLGMSKRQFIEMALIEAMAHVRHLIDCTDALGENQDGGFDHE